MATETLTVQTASRTAAAAFTFQNVTSAGGFKFSNDGHTILVVSNDAGDLALAVTVQVTIDGEAVSTKDITVAASTIKFCGPFPINIYNNSDGYVVVTPDADLATTYGVAPVSVR